MAELIRLFSVWPLRWLQLQSSGSFAIFGARNNSIEIIWKQGFIAHFYDPGRVCCLTWPFRAVVVENGIGRCCGDFSGEESWPIFPRILVISSQIALASPKQSTVQFDRTPDPVSGKSSKRRGPGQNGMHYNLVPRAFLFENGRGEALGTRLNA